MNTRNPYYCFPHTRTFRRGRIAFYHFRKWFWSNHTKEVEQAFKLVGQLIIAILWFGAVLFLPHIFH